MEFINQLLAGQKSFIAHGDCVNWSPTLLRLMLGSDIVTGLAYYALAGFLLYLMLIRKDFPFRRMFLLFGLFLFTCGSTYFMSAWTIYTPSYWAEGALQAINAAVSALTALLLFPLLPKIIELPNLQAALDKSEALNQERHLNIANLNLEIDRRKKIEFALQDSEQHFRSYFELGQIGLAETSPDKHWIRVNRQLCEMLGYTREEISQMTWAEMTHPDDLTPDEAQFNRVIAGEIDGYTLEKRFVRKDGQIVYTILSLGCQRQEDGSVDYFIASLQDTTAQKQAEHELQRHRDELEDIVDQRTSEITEKNERMHRFVMLSAERELRIQELRQENERLQQALQAYGSDRPRDA